MVGGHQFAVVGNLEQGKFSDPTEVPLIFRDQIQLVGQVQAQPAQHRIDQFFLTKLQEHQIVFFKAHRRVDIVAQPFAQGLHRALRPYTPFANARAGQAPGAKSLGEFFQLIHFGARHFRRPLCGQAPGLDHAGLFSRGGRDGCAQQIHAAAVVFSNRVRDIEKRQAEPQVRLV